MKFTEQKIKGVWLIEPESHVDERGLFRRHFCQKEYSEHGLDIKVAQANISENKKAYTLRGFHYQPASSKENKSLSCVKGAIYDIVVDLRPKSTSYLKWIPFKLDEENRKSLYVPAGCANAFLTLKDNSVVHYYHSDFFNPKNTDRGFRYDDPSFKFKWPRKPLVISDKDKNLPNFRP
jgi:dTDP-4-dehydrorhamnose 3,5-epimerase